MGKQRRSRCLFHHLSRIQNSDFIRHLAGDAQIMRNQQQRHTPALLQVAQESQDLRLHRHIQRRRRLIGDQNIGLSRQHHGHQGALALAAGQLERVAVGMLRLQTHIHQKARHRLSGAVRRERLLNLRGDRHDRIKAAHRLLKHHRHSSAAQTAHLPLRQGEHILTLQSRTARGDRHPVRQQTHQRQRRQRLSATRFAQHHQTAPRLQIQRHAIHRATAIRQADNQIA